MNNSKHGEEVYYQVLYEINFDVHIGTWEKKEGGGIMEL